MPAAPDFRQTLSAQRPYERRAASDDLAYLIDQLESDRGRIVHSAAVRRLQQKTQVFPLERNAAVRSRLTHSLEVQQTGRFIVRTCTSSWVRARRTTGWTGWNPRWKAWWRWPACCMTSAIRRSGISASSPSANGSSATWIPCWTLHCPAPLRKRSGWSGCCTT